MSASYRDGVLSHNPSVFYQMGINADAVLNETGDGNNGNLFGNFHSVSDERLTPNSPWPAISFVDDILDNPNSALMAGVNGLTVGAILRVDSIPFDRGSIFTGTVSQGYVGVSINVYPDGSLVCYARSKPTDSANTTTLPAETISLSTVHFISLVVDFVGGTIAIYIDGALAIENVGATFGQTTFSGFAGNDNSGLATNTSSQWMRWDWASKRAVTSGLLDSAFIIGNALDAQQVNTLFDAAFSEPLQVSQSSVSGVVKISNVNISRQVRAFSYDSVQHVIDSTSITGSKSLGHTTSDPVTGEYTIDLLDGYSNDVFVVAFDNYGLPFVPGLSLAVGQRVHPTIPNGYVYECDGAGTLPSTEPTWSIDTETSQVYGTASLIARPFYRPVVHGPIVPEVVELSPGP